MLNCKMITEKFLQYIWMHHVRTHVKYTMVNGVEYVVLNKGILNTDAGADVQQVVLKIDGIEWAGAVEFHVKSSDWERHGHHADAAYNNVILHFVAEADCEVFSASGRKIPNAIFPKLDTYYTIYIGTFQKGKFVHCENSFSEVSDITKSLCLQNMAIERLEQKTQAIFHLLEQNNNHWEETLYQIVARYMGQKLNGDAFEQLARKTPQSILAKHRNSLLQIESLLFGQAGMLENTSNDTYYIQLKKEYDFLKKKYKLKQMPAHRWKLLRLRPANFPTVRIAQLAMLVHQSHGLFSQVIKAEDTMVLRQMFDFGASSYWEQHYTFENTSTGKSTKHIGKTLQDVLLINAVIPVLFAYGSYSGQESFKDKALHLLEDIATEKNYITRGWEQLGLQLKGAFDSQATIQLKEKYCKKGKCHECGIGHEILKKRYQADK